MGLSNACMKKIIIYGINQQAEQLYAYLTQEHVWVEAFCVDRDYYTKNTLCGKPVICFENISNLYPPEEYAILLSFGYKNMVANREEKYYLCKQKGYEIPTFICKDAHVYTNDIGDGVIIYPNVTIGPCVKVGKGCFFELSCTIAHHSEVGNFNFFASGVITGGAIKTGNNCFFGISSIIASGKKIADRTLVGAGVCLTKDTLSDEVYRHGENIMLTHPSRHYI